MKIDVREVETIEEVISQLELIILWSKEEKSRLGIFAGLYLIVTRKIKELVDQGYFEDNARMERLDVVFANRYLEAVRKYLDAEEASLGWMFSFDATQSNRYLILQHLLFGMNAHINLDLGIAAAQSAPGESIHTLKNDFITINAVLGSLVNQVTDGMAELSPWLGWLETLSGKFGDTMINFSIGKARDFAWDLARELALAPAASREAIIHERDVFSKKLSQKVASPGILIGWGIFFIGLRETTDMVKIIDVLSDHSVNMEDVEERKVKIQQEFAESEKLPEEEKPSEESV